MSVALSLQQCCLDKDSRGLYLLAALQRTLADIIVSSLLVLQVHEYCKASENAVPESPATAVDEVRRHALVARISIAPMVGFH